MSVLEKIKNDVVESQVWKSIFRHGYEDTPRNRVMMVTSNVFLHLHPAKVRRHAVRMRFTWCMGGLTFLMFLVTAVTGIYLMFYYRPVAEYAYADMKYLEFDMPFGMLMRKIAVARFCRTLSTLLASGVSILEALDITARTSGNAVVEESIGTTRKSIEGGETIADPLRETGVFPPMVVQMIGVGEATGALDTMLSKIADFYEDEVDVAVAGMLTLLEPVMIAFLGGVVGGIVIAMYMPIFDLISKLTG